jgi:rifampicin phosphotransferase
MTSIPARLPEREPDAGPDGDEFPIAWPDPEDERLSWERDDMHMPFALPPLAIDHVRVMGRGFNPGYERFGSPMRVHLRIFHGYCYFAASYGVPSEEVASMLGRLREAYRAFIPQTRAYWNEELPRLQADYRMVAETDVDGLSGDALADAWDWAWEAMQRAWVVHFIVIRGAYRVSEDLADFYEKVVPDAPPGQALRLIQGANDILQEVEAGVERLAGIVAANPALVERLGRQPMPALEEIATLDGGSALLAAIDPFLAEHGHLGSGFDDLSQATWGDEPAILLGEIAQRPAHAPEPATRRRARLVAESEALATDVRASLADRPEELAAFEALLAHARDVGPLTETHNYWIDRMTQGRTRTLAVRVGRRLAREGVIEDAADVFYLDRAEIGELLRRPAERRALVEERRAEHERQKRMNPPRVLGRPEEDFGFKSRFDVDRQEPAGEDQLTGTGASAGIVRGPARVALGPEDFGRIQPGDIIVCPSSNPSWVPVFAIAGGLVTNTGGVLAHAAVVAREFGLPAVVGVAGATTRIRDGQEVEIDGTKGTVRLL